jgi:TolA-binding protein
MKTILLSFVLALFTFMGYAQTTDSPTVGKIEYYEGNVMIGSGSEWSAAKINADVKGDQSIRTVGDAMAEVTWNSGVKSVIGPNSNIPVKSLLDGSTSNAKEQTQGSFNNFKRIFSEKEANNRTQEGGIRRMEAEEREKPAKDEIYWKSDKEIFFDEAYAIYESGDYVEAIKNLQGFIDQKPKDEMVRYAYFALGHSYIMTNNTVKAKEIFSRFIRQFPGEDLTAEAEKINDQL